MGELQTEPFQFTFNGFLKVAFQGSRITSDAGLILVRELDERLGLATLIAEHLSDSRQGLNTQFRSGPRNLDSGLSEISIVSQAAVPKPVAPKYTTSGVRRPSEL